MKTEREQLAAEFRRVDGMFGAGAFELTNDSTLPMEELIVVVMGVHAIQKKAKRRLHIRQRRKKGSGNA